MSGPAATGLTVEGFFGPGGLLARAMPEWELREGQLDMAHAVQEAIEEQRHLIVEAGTGTGKTLAYLVPLVLSDKRAVISTATKNLQDQLVRKDLPFLRRLLKPGLRVAVMKGRNNFLCLDKLQEFERRPTLPGLAVTKELERILEWAKKTQTGDRADVPGLARGSKLWPRIDARREACSGRDCPLFEDCFVTRMHQRARAADIVIVNHHLYFADLSLKEDDFGPIVPRHAAVVFDEAHAIEAVAGQLFGASLGAWRFDDLASKVQVAARQKDFGSRRMPGAVRALRARTKAFFALFDDVSLRTAFTGRSEFRRKHEAEFRGLVGAIDGVMAELSLVKGHADQAQPLLSQGRELRLLLRTFLADVDDALLDDADDFPALVSLIDDTSGRFVYWMERRPRGVSLNATPVEVGPILDERLFGADITTVLASATLSIEGRFEYIRSRLGLRSCSESVIPGHFDFRRQAVLYVPRRMPQPSHPAFTARAATEIEGLLDITHGRAFVLFTSYKQMKAVHPLVSRSLMYPCLMQGTEPNAQLLERFLETEHCVLFATASFWQGVDVPGRRLSCVIIDKLPFAVPTDPVVQARLRRIHAQGGNPFAEFQLPVAALSLKQGFGRLIRSTSDRGVLALLDTRVRTKPYGRVFLNSLPDFEVTDDLGAVRAFFDSGDAVSQAVQGRLGRRRAFPRR